MLLFLNKSSSAQLALRDGFQAAAGAFRGEVSRSHGGDPQPWVTPASCHPPISQVLFVVVDVAGYGANVLTFFGMTPADAPTLRLVKMKNNRKYRMEQDSFSDAAISTFIQAVLDGKVKVRGAALRQPAPGVLVAPTPDGGSCVVSTTCVARPEDPGGVMGKEAGDH